MKRDERCPCLVCAVQAVCTDYCTRFHFYRKLVLAEIDFFISQVIDEYHPSGKRPVSQIERDITTAYLQSSRNGTENENEYRRIKMNLLQLEYRFEVTVRNSRLAKRGLVIKMENEE